MAREGQVEQEWSQEGLCQGNLDRKSRVDERKEEARGRSSGCRDVRSILECSWEDLVGPRPGKYIPIPVLHLFCCQLFEITFVYIKTY